MYDKDSRSVNKEKDSSFIPLFQERKSDAMEWELNVYFLWLFNPLSVNSFHCTGMAVQAVRPRELHESPRVVSVMSKGLLNEVLR